MEVRNQRIRILDDVMIKAMPSDLCLYRAAIDAIIKGADYVQSAMRDGLTVGHGKGCLNHFHHVVSRSIER